MAMRERAPHAPPPGGHTMALPQATVRAAELARGAVVFLSFLRAWPTPEARPPLARGAKNLSPPGFSASRL